jgi:hypothetical protein
MLPLGLPFCYQIGMAKPTLSDNRKKKRIGRPPVGAILIGVRVPPADVATLDAWIKNHAPEMSRPEAIRRLVELGLAVKSVARPTAKAAVRAAELATKAIDKHADMSAPSAEREARKNKLFKGPSVFWNVRKGM